MDVSAILANKKSLSSPFTIKSDMSPEERKIESILLKERWSLIQIGHNRKQIKLSSNRIFVNNQLYGEVINSVFKCHSSTNVVTPLVENSMDLSSSGDTNKSCS